MRQPPSGNNSPNPSGPYGQPGQPGPQGIYGPPPGKPPHPRQPFSNQPPGQHNQIHRAPHTATPRKWSKAHLWWIIPSVLILVASPGSFLVLLSIVVFVTSAWHGITGKSWMTRFWIAGGRKTAAAGTGAAMVAVIAGAVLMPASDAAPPEAVPVPAVSSPATVESEPAPVTTVTEVVTVTPRTELTPTQKAASMDVTAVADPTGIAAVALLSELPVKGRAQKTGYDRAMFGQRWADIDRNGCDQRNDILNRDLTEKTYKPDTRECVVLTGVLIDPFTATVINFTRGNDTSNTVQIDHVVALSDAWQKGAQQLTPQAREFLANDPLNLLAVDGPTNGSKGDGDAATWLPPNKAFRCDYVTRQVAVKHKYQLWVTKAEHDNIAGIHEGCPDQTVLGSDLAPSVTATHAPAKSAPAATAAPPPPPTTTQAPEPPPVEPEPQPEPADVYFKNCTAARAAGAAPLYRGEPGYRKAMDRDGDGVACE